LCIECQEIKVRDKTTGLPCKAILENNFNCRAQMDLIDFQTCPDGEFKWLLVYQDRFGIETPMGLKATRVPIESWKDMKSAKDLFRICGVPYDDLEDDQKILDFDDDDEDENVDDVFEFDKQSV
jgi:hypothetical protein